jgi:hypothetical protein
MPLGYRKSGRRLSGSDTLVCWLYTIISRVGMEVQTSGAKSISYADWLTSRTIMMLTPATVSTTLNQVFDPWLFAATKCTFLCLIILSLRLHRETADPQAIRVGTLIAPPQLTPMVFHRQPPSCRSFTSHRRIDTVFRLREERLAGCMSRLLKRLHSFIRLVSNIASSAIPGPRLALVPYLATGVSSNPS